MNEYFENKILFNSYFKFYQLIHWVDSTWLSCKSAGHLIKFIYSLLNFFRLFLSVLLFSVAELKIRPVQNHRVCSVPDPKKDFDVSMFVGVWYEIFAYPNTLTSGGKCVVSTFILGAKTSLSIYTRFIDYRGMDTRVMGSAEIKDPGTLFVEFPAARELKILLKYLKLNNSIF